MRLGLIGPVPPPNGGMAMQTQQLSRLLTEEGVTVELLATNPPYRPAFVERLQGIRALFRLLPYFFNIWRLCGRVDVIHLMANSGWSWQLFAAPVLWLAWLRGTPVIVNYRGGEAREYLRNSARWVKPSLVKATSVVVPSGFLRDVFKEFGVATSVVPNIVDLQLFAPGPARQAGSPFTFAITRNLERIYGLDVAVRALALASESEPDLRLCIAGSGPQKLELEALAKELGISDSVEFLGRLDRAGVVALYHRADGALNPTRVDNMPNSVLEALACGLPVISTSVGGVPYIVENEETALLVTSENVEEMANAMLRLYRDTSLRDRLREAGMAAVKQYSWEQVKPLWFDQYRREEAFV